MKTVKENAVVKCDNFEQLKECREKLIRFGFKDDIKWNESRLKLDTHKKYPDMCYVYMRMSTNNIQIHTHNCDCENPVPIKLKLSELDSYLEKTYGIDFENPTDEQKELIRYWIEKYNDYTIGGTNNEFFKQYLSVKPKIETGKFYKAKNPESKFMVFIESFEEPDSDNNSVKSFGFSKYGDWMDSELRCPIFLSKNCIEATEQEVKERLIEEAKKYIGKIFIRFSDGSKISVESNFHEFEFHPDGLRLSSMFKGKQCLTLNGNVVMFDGKWAEIIDPKEETKKAIAELEEKLTELKKSL